MAKNNPYRVCITRNQLKELFGKNASRAMKRGPQRWEQGAFSDLRKGIPPEDRLSALGCGAFACAWEAGAGKVVKITNDPTDVVALLRARKAGIEGVPRVYKAFELGSRNTSKKPVYALVTERLYTNVAGKENVDCIREGAVTELPRVRIAETCCRPLPAGVKWRSTTTAVTARTKAGSGQRRRKQIKQRDNARLMCHRMAFQLPKTLRKLSRIGIELPDMHEGQVGVNAENRWKIFDLGLSAQRTGRQIAPVLKGPTKRRRR